MVYIEVLLLDAYYMMQLKYKQFKLKSIYMIQLKDKKFWASCINVTLYNFWARIKIVVVVVIVVARLTSSFTCFFGTERAIK